MKKNGTKRKFLKIIEKSFQNTEKLLTNRKEYAILKTPLLKVFFCFAHFWVKTKKPYQTREVKHLKFTGRCFRNESKNHTRLQ